MKIRKSELREQIAELNDAFTTMLKTVEDVEILKVQVAGLEKEVRMLRGIIEKWEIEKHKPPKASDMIKNGKCPVTIHPSDARVPVLPTEPKSKRCHNCKYEKQSVCDKPCSGCNDRFDKWQPKPVRKPKEEPVRRHTRTCFTCTYENLEAHQKPCRQCDITCNKWKSKKVS